MMNGYELKLKLNLDVDPLVVDQLLIHNSFYNELKNDTDDNKRFIRNQNEYYSVLGKDLIEIIVFINLYINKNIKSIHELSEQLRIIKPIVYEVIYDKYDIGAFIYLSKGELNNKNNNKKIYTEVLDRIVYIIYEQVGFFDLFNMLSDIFINLEVQDIFDYKALLQEYTQPKGVVPIYNFESKLVENNMMEFVAELSIFNKNFTGKGKSKKMSSGEAAKSACLFYNINQNKKNNIKYSMLRHDRKWEVDKERKAQLEIIYKNLKISENELPWHYLDACFTHKSIENEKNHQNNYDDNVFLSMLGSIILIMMINECLWDEFKDNNIDIAALKNSIASNDNLRLFIPKNWEELIIKSKTFKNFDPDISIISIDAFKAILGALFLFAFRNHKNNLFLETYKIVNKIYLKSFDKLEPNYTGVLEKIVTTLGLSLKVNKINHTGKDNSRNFYCELELFDENNIINSTVKIGEGKTIIKAKSNASFEMLKHIDQYINTSFINSNLDSPINSFKLNTKSLSKIRNELYKTINLREEKSNQKDSIELTSEEASTEKFNEQLLENNFDKQLNYEKNQSLERNNIDDINYINVQGELLSYKDKLHDKYKKEINTSSINNRVDKHISNDITFKQPKDIEQSKFNDYGEEKPDKLQRVVEVTKRNTTIVKQLKELYNHECQICGIRIPVANNQFICEVHHVQPLGSHLGADKSENMIVLCPNHHAMFDNGLLSVDLVNKTLIHSDSSNELNNLKVNIKHKIDFKYVEYHYKNIFIHSDTINNNSCNIIKYVNDKSLSNIIGYGDTVTIKDLTSKEEFEMTIERIFNKIFMTPIQKSVVGLSLGDKFNFLNYDYEIISLLKGL